jgi:hypothetical protein
MVDAPDLGSGVQVAWEFESPLRYKNNLHYFYINSKLNKKVIKMNTVAIRHHRRRRVSVS